MRVCDPFDDDIGVWVVTWPLRTSMRRLLKIATGECRFCGLAVDAACTDCDCAVMPKLIKKNVPTSTEILS